VKRGNRARFQQGWPNFRPPAGYLEDRATKTVIKDPVNFDLVRRAWDLLLSGSTRPRQILATLNNECGFRSRSNSRGHGKPMSFSGLYAAFKNPYYMGLSQLRNGETYKGGHSPMITEQEYARAQEILGRPGRPRPAHHDFAFAGLLRCASCGRALVGEVHTKPSGKRYTYYRCHRRGHDSLCGEPTLPEQAFTDQMVRDLGRMTLKPEVARWITQQLSRTLRTEAQQLSSVRESVERALSQARTEEDTLLSLRLRGSVDDETYERRRLDISSRRAHLDLQLDAPLPTVDTLLERVEWITGFAQAAPQLFRNGTPVQQRQVLETIGSSFRVTARKVAYDAKKPFVFFDTTASDSSWYSVVERLPTWIIERNFQIPEYSFDTLDTVPRKRQVA